eukprot:gene8589-414_t
MVILKDQQCLHINSKTDIYHHNLVESIYYGPHVYVGIPLLFLGVSLSMSLFLFFKKKIRPPVKILKEKEQQVNHFLDIERKFDVKMTLQNRFKQIFLSLFIDNNDLVRNCGTDSYYYTWFNKYLIIYSFICGLLSIIFLLPIYSNSNDFKMYTDFSSTTIASIDFRISNYSLNHLLFTIIYLIFGIFFLKKLKFLSNILIKGNKDYSSLYTVMITNLNPNLIKQEELLQEFQERYGMNNVLSAHVSYDLSRISTSIKKREELSTILEMKRNEYLQTNIRPSHKSKIFGKKIDSIDFYQEEIMKLNEIIKLEKMKEVQGTGYGFITFNSIELARKCINENSSWDIFGFPIFCLNYEIESAPEFDDIFWDNMSIGTIRRTITSWIFNLLLLIFLFLIYIITYFTSVYLYKKYQWSSWLTDFISEFQSTKGILRVLFELLPILVSILNEAIKPIIDLVSRFESHITRITYSTSILKKTLTMMFFNYLIFPRLYSYFVGIWSVPFSDEPFNNYIYFFNLNGVSILQQSIALCTIAKGLELFFLFIGQMVKLFLHGYIERPKFDYEGNLAFRVVFLILWLVYGSIQPLIFPFILLYYIATYVLDKILIMYLYERSEDSNGHAIKYVYENLYYYFIIFPFIVLLLTPSSLLMFKTWILYLPSVFLFIYYLRYLKRTDKQKENLIIYGNKIDDSSNGNIDVSILVGKEQKLSFEEIEIDFTKISAKYQHPYLKLLK